MKYKALQLELSDRKNLNKFLSLPKKLYAENELMQNKNTEKNLIYGRHILSKYFKVYPFITIDSGKNIASRCVLTVYPDTKCGYIGFFESIDDSDAALAVLSKAEEFAVKLGLESLTGPVDCSFWIRYRLKTNHFGNPYTGEPYNKSYYEKFFKEAGYGVTGEYISNRFKKATGYNDSKFSERLEKYLQKGYSIESPSTENFDSALRAIYKMIIVLYSDFQTFSPITEEEFVSIYTPLKNIIDYKMVKIAYFNGVPAGFFVSVPNIGNAANGVLTPKKLLAIFKSRRHCRDYVMLYMGVMPEHRGLGKALAESIKRELAENGAESVGALIRSGKVTADYFSELVEYQYEYRLYGKQISDLT